MSAMATQDDIADKQRLDELTDKQRKAVELKAANPHMSASAIDDAIGSNNYAYTIIEKYEHLINELREQDRIADIEANCEEPGKDTSANGRIKTEWENGSFEGNPIDATMSYLSETNASVQTEAMNTDTISLCFELDRRDIEHVLTSEDAPMEVREKVTSELMELVF